VDIFAILIAIIGIAASVFSGSGQKENHKPRSGPVARPTPTPSGRTYQEPEVKRKTRESEPEPLAVDPQNKYQEKLNELNRGNISSQNSSDDFISNPPRKKVSTNPVLTPISVKKQLTKKRIAESIIMSEVLGSPRAHKPYSYDNKRKIK
jgi:hypothetical protein